MRFRSSVSGDAEACCVWQSNMVPPLMEAAAEAALEQQALSYPAVKQIIEAHIRAGDEAPRDAVVHANVRGPAYYRDAQLNGNDSC